MDAFKKTLMTAFKYAIWTAAGALASFGITEWIPALHGQFIIMAPILSMVFKALATYAATQAANCTK